MVQRRVRPLLLPGLPRVFDVGLYVLVSSVRPLRVWAFNRSLVRVCLSSYPREMRKKGWARAAFAESSHTRRPKAPSSTPRGTPVSSLRGAMSSAEREFSNVPPTPGSLPPTPLGVGDTPSVGRRPRPAALPRGGLGLSQGGVAASSARHVRVAATPERDLPTTPAAPADDAAAADGDDGAPALATIWGTTVNVETVMDDFSRFVRQFKPRPCLLYTSPSPRDATLSRMPSSA